MWGTVTMTTVYERTRSVVETGIFLASLSRDKSLPDYVRSQARQLLRHYPSAGTVSLAGRCEAIRQNQILALLGSPSKLHPALSTWPLLEPFFCDPTDRDAPQPITPPELAAVTALQSISGTEGKDLVLNLQVFGLSASEGMGCFSIEYRCFTSVQAQILSRATLVLGSPARAQNWFCSRIRSLDGRQPCTLIQSAREFVLVREVLTRLEHGIF